MTDFKSEMLVYFIQILVLIAFSFILDDILAALIVSFLSRPLAKMSMNIYRRRLNKQ